VTLENWGVDGIGNISRSHLPNKVITRHGRPAAVMVGVEGKDWEDLVLQTSSNFWKLVKKRREQPTISVAELRSRLKKSKK
jgi:antitoxin (DNA-binding transcriptional repressor) of toxin-antitoxin stability system